MVSRNPLTRKENQRARQIPLSSAGLATSTPIFPCKSRDFDALEKPPREPASIAMGAPLRHQHPMPALHDPAVETAISAYFEAITVRNLAGWLSLFADDAICHEPVGTPAAEGHEGLEEVWRVLTSPFESVSIQL